MALYDPTDDDRLEREADAMNRDEMIEFLTNSDFEYIIQGDGGGLELLESYILFGFKGYMNFTDAELISEVKERKEMNNA